jgi:Sec-independent protein secretion pathway component TatC
VFTLLSPLLTTLFVVGVAGCVFVIPVVAYKLFSALFEGDIEDENGKLVPHD